MKWNFTNSRISKFPSVNVSASVYVCVRTSSTESMTDWLLWQSAKPSPRKNKDVAQSSIDRISHPKRFNGKARPIHSTQVPLQELPEWRNISGLPIGSPCKDWLPCISEGISLPIQRDILSIAWGPSCVAARGQRAPGNNNGQSVLQFC